MPTLYPPAQVGEGSARETIVNRGSGAGYGLEIPCVYRIASMDHEYYTNERNSGLFKSFWTYLE